MSEKKIKNMRKIIKKKRLLNHLINHVEKLQNVSLNK